jgi:hypothetical protein
MWKEKTRMVKGPSVKIEYEDGHLPGDEKLTEGQLYEKQRNFEWFNQKYGRKYEEKLELPPMNHPSSFSQRSTSDQSDRSVGEV